MGTFDSLKCRYPLPAEGANGREYQTKDTPSQYLHRFEIDEDGVLRDLDSVEEDKAQHDFIGEIRFYDMDTGGGWIEFSAYFVNGVLKEVHLISDTRMKAVSLEKDCPP